MSCTINHKNSLSKHKVPYLRVNESFHSKKTITPSLLEDGVVGVEQNSIDEMIGFGNSLG